MFCPDCGSDLAQVPVGTPCPDCAGKRRQAVVELLPISTVAVAEEVSYVIGKGDQRNWAEQWQRLVRGRDAIQSAYSLDGVRSSLDIENSVLSFFCDCSHLKDWMLGDIEALPGVTSHEIDDHIGSSQALLCAEALCNTSKHHTRRVGRVTARIRQVEVAPETARVTIEVEWATPNATHHDALDLADRCIGSWREFLAEFNIPEP